MTVELEDRLSAALDRLATAYVPDTGENGAVASRSRRRALTVAATVIAAVGVAGLTMVIGRDAAVPVTTDPTPVVVDTTLASPALAEPVAADDAEPEATSIRMLATLPTEVGGPGEVTPALRQWLFAPLEEHNGFAVRTSSTGSIDDVLSWTLLQQSEWSKTFWDRPDVWLPSGTVVKRLTGAADSRITYALQRPDGSVLAASSGPDHEDEMARWFDSTLRSTETTELSRTVPPAGYQLVASPVRTEAVRYPPVDVTVITSQFPVDQVWDVETWALTHTNVSEVTPVDGHDAVLVDHGDGATRSVFARLDDDLGVQLVGSDPDQLTALLDRLVVRDADSLTIPERSDPSTVPMTATEVSTIRGELSLGRFSIVEYTDQEQRCRTLDTNFTGGGGGCGPVDGPERNPYTCNAAASLIPETGEYQQLVLVIAPTELAGGVGLAIDGQVRDATIEPVTSPDGDPGLSAVWATARTKENPTISFLDGSDLLAPPLPCH